PQSQINYHPRFELITVTTDTSGNASVTSDNTLFGELLGIYYDNGTITTSTTAVISLVTPITLTLDTYDINSNDTYHPIFVDNVDNDDHSRYPLTSKITVTVTGGQASKTFYVYVVYR
ncbi:MAG: hypothetical protein WC918_10020, partial [Bacteroidales bacterium]